MAFLKKYFKQIVLVVLLLAVLLFGHAVYRETPNNALIVAFLNIGQGDSAYVESPTHRKILIDGGPNASVLSEIGKLMPWYDHNIDALVISNSDVDHFGGFIDLIKRYHVGLVVESGAVGGAPSYKTLEELIAQKKITRVLASRGDSLDIGGGVHLDFLFPDRDPSKMKTNDASFIAQLVYASTTVMFTGDAPNATEEYVLSLASSDKTGASSLKSDILKAGHHGSRTSASESFVSAVAPKYGIISAGLDNSYGHPHQETLDLFDKLKIQTLITFKLGTIIFKSDGMIWWR